MRFNIIKILKYDKIWYFSGLKHARRYRCHTLKNWRSSRPEVFLRKGVLIICSKFTEEHPIYCCIYLEHLFLGTPLGGCFWKWYFSVIDITESKPYKKLPTKTTLQMFVMWISPTRQQNLSIYQQCFNISELKSLLQDLACHFVSSKT